MVHRWLGLTSGCIVFIVAITGSIFAFHDEIADLIYSYRKVPPREQSFVSPSILLRAAVQDHEDAIFDMVVYQSEDRPANVYGTLKGVPHEIYYNPYTGQELFIRNLDTDFFLIIEKIHRFLYLPEAVGKQVVGIATIVFLFMLISGIFLWFPRNKKHLRDYFRIRWNARWRRINFDWHRITGIYVCLLALIVALTGLSFSYEWMHEAFYSAGNLGQREANDFFSPVVSKAKPEDIALDIAWKRTLEMLPESGMSFIFRQGETLPLLTGAYPFPLEFHHQSNFYFDQRTGALLHTQLYDSKSNGLQLQEMNYGLHTGQYFGLPGKIVAFFISLFIAGLPVSGFLIWWGRKNR
ncbi:PepSY domain-containing protein [Robertkochia solimangrovi]|nr:PepSY domain-containing protein [Robertkochia solimangrovi]